MRTASFALRPVPPFRLDLTAWAIRRRPTNATDRWDGDAYRRAIVVDDRPVDLEVVQAGAASRPLLHVTARGESLPQSTRTVATAVLERVLGLRIDLRPFYRLAGADPHLRELVARFRGVKPPRFPSVFEAVVNGIACQQLSLSVGIVLLNRLVERCGPAVRGAGAGSAHAFPRAADVADLPPSALRSLGYSGNKTRALLSLARGVEHGLDLETLHAASDADAVAQLEDLPGVGRWTAEYVLDEAAHAARLRPRAPPRAPLGSVRRPALLPPSLAEPRRGRAPRARDGAARSA